MRPHIYASPLTRDFAMTIGPDQLKLSPSEIRSFFDDASSSPHLKLDVFDLAAVAMGLVSPSGYWVRANPAMSNLFGYHPDEFLGIHTDVLVHPEDYHLLHAHRSQFFAREIDHANLELRCLDRSGESFWTRQHLTALRMPSQAGTYLLIQIEDITELRALEARRRQQEDLHRTLIQHLPGVLVAVVDRDYRFQLVEGDGLQHHGLTNESILGLTPWEAAGTGLGNLLAAHVRRALAGESQTFEVERDGRYYQAHAIPMMDDRGEIISGMVVFIDITDLKVAEASRQRRGEIYRAIVRNLPGAIAAVFDKDLRYLLVDGHGLADLGLTPDMIEGKTADEYWGAYRRDTVVHHLQATIDGEPQAYEGKIGGREYEIRTAPIPESDGSVDFGVVVNFDITQRKVHEREMQAVSEALAKSNRDLEEFASVAAHDLRAPLVTVHGLATILAEDYRAMLDSDGRHLIDRIVANADQMQKLLGELLEISRLGRRESDFTLVNLQDVIEHVRKHLNISLDRRNATLVADVGQVTVLANWTRIVQLFMNLVDNAIKYTPVDQAPHIEISAVEEHDQWRISVADNGVGIPEDYRETVFDMFHRLRIGQQLNPQGSGMGLALVERIVSLHGGQIWIDPDVQEGTTFHITLPRLEATENGESV